MKDEDTAEFLWQAKLSKGDYHASMTDVMSMEWLERRLAPAFKKLFGDKKMILVLDNASYHHGFDEEVGVPETNSKYNVELLRKFGAKSITVRRKQTALNVGVAEFHFEVPQDAGPTFPGVISVGGVSKEEVAIATREYLQLHPTKLVERVEAFMQGKGWELIWTPPTCQRSSRSSCFGSMVRRMSASILKWGERCTMFGNRFASIGMGTRGGQDRRGGGSRPTVRSWSLMPLAR